MTDAQGNGPGLRRQLGAEARIAFLGRDQLVAVMGDMHDRQALLVDEALHRRQHARILGGVGQSAEEFVGGRITIGVTRHVQAHAFAELVVAQIGGDHCDDLPPLAVGDRIESGIDLAVTGNRLVDRAADLERIGRHGAIGLTDGADADIELGTPFVADTIAHPVGEAFIEPDIVPPGRRHIVAEPLMRQLVRDDHAEVLLVDGRCIVVERDDLVAIDVSAGVFHSAGHDGRADLVELRIGEAHIEVGFEVGDDRRRFLQRVGQLVLVGLGGDDADRQRITALRCRRGDAFGDRERADDHGHQIGRKRLGRGEDVLDQAIAGVAMARFGSVRRRRKARLGRQGHREGRLEARLVERRKGRARIYRFELRPRVPVVADLDVIQAFGAVAERRVVVELERNLASLERRREGNL